MKRQQQRPGDDLRACRLTVGTRLTVKLLVLFIKFDHENHCIFVQWTSNYISFCYPIIIHDASFYGAIAYSMFSFTCKYTILAPLPLPFSPSEYAFSLNNSSSKKTNHAVNMIICDASPFSSLHQLLYIVTKSQPLNSRSWRYINITRRPCPTVRPEKRNNI